MAEPTFAQLVSLACHDLRTPLATASGFAHTLQRLNSLEKPADRYVEMIGTASDQIADLLDLLSAVTRIEAGRFEAQLREADSRQLVDVAVRRLGEGHAAAGGSGAPIRVDPQWAETALAALGECVRRHGALEQVEYAVEGPAIAIGPVGDSVAAIALGADLRDFPAAVATRILRAIDATLEHEGQQLMVRLPPA